MDRSGKRHHESQEFQGHGDPSLVDGYVEAFSDEVNIEFRNFQNQESISRVVWVRILVKYSEDRKDRGQIGEIRFELFDDSDLYYFYDSTFTRELFDEMKQKDQLLIDFDSFPDEVITLLDKISVAKSTISRKDDMNDDDDPQIQIMFIEETDPSDPSKLYGTMEFLQILELKAVEIFKIHFEPSAPEFVQEQVQYRFNQINKQLAYKKAFLNEFNKQIQTKNPILYKTLTKSPKASRR